MPARGGPDDLKLAMRSVRIDPVLSKAIPGMAKMVSRVARANLMSVPGTFSRSHAKVGAGRGKGGRFAGGVEISGGLAAVAEYGMTGRHWFLWGRHRQPSRVPPPRFGKGRPGPEDGHVIGKAYRMVKEDLHEFAADEMWKAYQIQFDKQKIYKVRG